MTTASTLDPTTISAQTLRTPRAVAERALLLQAVHLRGWLEDQAVGQAHMPMARALDRIAQLKGWIEDNGLEGAATEEELLFIRSTTGRVEPDRITDAYWQMDTIGVLVWSLGMLDKLPPFDAPFDAQAVLKQLPRVGETVGDFAQDVTLRPAEDLGPALEGAQLWQWRAECAADASQPDADELAKRARRAAELGLLDLVMDGDFSVMATPYSQIDDKRRELVGRLAQERLAALAWVCGHDDL